jgi:hypothetical protein
MSATRAGSSHFLQKTLTITEIFLYLQYDPMYEPQQANVTVRGSFATQSRMPKGFSRFSISTKEIKQ